MIWLALAIVAIPAVAYCALVIAFAIAVRRDEEVLAKTSPLRGWKRRA